MTDKQENKSMKFVGIAMAILIAAVAVAAVFYAVTPIDTDAELDALAQSLSDEGWALYTTTTCPVCIDQKAIFEGSIQYITIVECDTSQENYDMCMRFNITAVPTWINEDSRVAMQGFQSIETLMGMVKDSTIEQE